MKISKTFIDTPLGEMYACATDKGICLLEFHNRKNIEGELERLTKSTGAEIKEEDHPLFEKLRYELKEYFDGKFASFSVPLDLVGTDFQKKVWTELLKIPYGKTISYKDLANNLGDIKAVRAVANANGMNKIALIVPCHRVIGSDGSLVGYAGGLERKTELLSLEKKGFDKL